MTRITWPLANSMPRRDRALVKNVAIMTGCLAIVVLVLLGEELLTENATFGGFLLIAVLLAGWLLPLRLNAVVALCGLGVPWYTIVTGHVDSFTGKFQFIAVAATVVLIELTARGLLRAERDERHANETLRRFAADAAHELRTPLTAMRSDLSTTLTRERNVGELRTSVERALANTDRLIRVAEAMLAVARSDAGLLEISGEPLDLADAVEEAIVRWTRHASQRGVALRQQVDGIGSVIGDRLLLDRLLDNLIENAVRHTPADGTVTLEVNRRGDRWELAVTDTGTGVPTEMRGRLFERFSAGDTSSVAPGGAGIGLALCSAIAKAHSASIGVDSLAVTGTRISVRFPVAQSSGGV